MYDAIFQRLIKSENFQNVLWQHFSTSNQNWQFWKGTLRHVHHGINTPADIHSQTLFWGFQEELHVKRNLYFFAAQPYSTSLSSAWEENLEPLPFFPKTNKSEKWSKWWCRTTTYLGIILIHPWFLIWPVLLWCLMSAACV